MPIGCGNLTTMEPDVGIWDRLTKVVAFLLVVSGIVLLIQLYVPLFKENQRLRERNLKLEAAISLEEKAARQLDQEIIALNRNPKAIERLAREQMGFAREGEVLFRFETAFSNAPPAKQ